MTRDRLVTMFVVLVAVALGVVVWSSTHHRAHTTTRVQTTTIVEAPPLTPLRDSGPKNNPVKSRASRGERAPASPVLDNPARRSRGQSGTRNRPLPAKKRKTPKAPHKPSGGAQQPSTPSPPPSQPPPVVGVTAPAPVTVCARPVATVNCP